MSQTNPIGFEKKEVTHVIEKLNTLLANYQLYYQNLRALHWNIKGDNFFELHAKFEEFYNDSQLKIDEIAERILTLGATPLHTFSDYLAAAKINEGKDISNDILAVKLVKESLQTLLALERDVIAEAGKVDDEGTIDLMTPFVSEQEKTIWMLNAWLNGR
ncbi:MAG: DNA starvation/stationary phase protection protein [Schleiferiaceae bacterium]|nr:DNA starvation/stationary phase protection protein [Schleiferiaceae bacterium]